MSWACSIDAVRHPQFLQQVAMQYLQLAEMKLHIHTVNGWQDHILIGRRDELSYVLAQAGFIIRFIFLMPF